MEKRKNYILISSLIVIVMAICGVCCLIFKGDEVTYSFVDLSKSEELVSYDEETISKVNSVSVWDGSSSTQPSGSGTSSSPYLIASAENLKWISDNAKTTLAYGKYYKQTVDIDLNNQPWTPICASVDGSYDYKNETYVYYYDGDNHIISNLYIDNTSNTYEYAGLFGFMGLGSTITNLGIASGNITSSIRSSTTGALCGVFIGDKVENCWNGATKSLLGSYYICPIANVAKTVYMTNCYNVGTCYGAGLVYEIWFELDVRSFGSLSKNLTLNVTNCWNSGEINSTGLSYYSAGLINKINYGVTGTFTGKVICNIVGCYNSGTITGGSCAGICGSVGGDSVKVNFNYCYNVGTLNSIRADYSATNETNYDNGKPYKYFGSAGILFEVTRSSTITFTQCFNSATMTSNNYYAGIYMAFGSDNYDPTISMTRCYNDKTKEPNCRVLTHGKAEGSSSSGTSSKSGSATYEFPELISRVASYYSTSYWTIRSDDLPILTALVTTVVKPSLDPATYDYTGSTIYAKLANLSGKVILTGTLSASEVGNYTITVSVRDTNYVTWTTGGTESYNLTWTITNPTVDVPTITSSRSFLYDGNTKTVTISSYDTGKISQSGPTSGETVQTYTITFSLKGTYKWTDGTTSAKSVTWDITKATNSWLTSPSISGWTYGETPKTPQGNAKFGSVTFTYKNSNNEAVTMSSSSPAGAYTMTATVTGNSNYTGLVENVSFTISQISLTPPNVTSDFTYDGNEKTVQFDSNYNSNLMTTSGTTKATNHSSTDYVVTITLTNNNYKWSTTANRYVTKNWNIGQRSISNAVITITTDKFVYDGTAKKPDPEVKDNL